MLNRREFFRKSAIGAAALTVPSLLGNDVKAHGFVNPVFEPLPLSILSFSFFRLVRERTMNMFGYFESCRFRYGLGAADLWNGMFESLDDDYINLVHTALKERQLVIPNIAADHASLIGRPSQDSPEDRARRRALQDKYLRISKKLGVGFLRFDAGPMRERGVTSDTDPWSDADFDYLVKRYREIAQYAYDHGFKAGAENHGGNAKYWPNMERLIKAVDHPGFGICNHFGGWVGTPEENVAIDKLAAKHVCHTHIPWSISESPLLQVHMNILRDVGYKGFYSTELHIRQNEYNLVGVQLSRVKAVLTSWNAGGTGHFIPPRN